MEVIAQDLGTDREQYTPKLEVEDPIIRRVVLSSEALKQLRTGFSGTVSFTRDRIGNISNLVIQGTGIWRRYYIPANIYQNLYNLLIRNPQWGVTESMTYLSNIINYKDMLTNVKIEITRYFSPFAFNIISRRLQMTRDILITLLSMENPLDAVKITFLLLRSKSFVDFRYSSVELSESLTMDSPLKLGNAAAVDIVWMKDSLNFSMHSGSVQWAKPIPHGGVFHVHIARSPLHAKLALLFDIFTIQSDQLALSSGSVANAPTKLPVSYIFPDDMSDDLKWLQHIPAIPVRTDFNPDDNMTFAQYEEHLKLYDARKLEGNLFIWDNVKNTQSVEVREALEAAGVLTFTVTDLLVRKVGPPDPIYLDGENIITERTVHLSPTLDDAICTSLDLAIDTKTRGVRSFLDDFGMFLFPLWIDNATGGGNFVTPSYDARNDSTSLRSLFNDPPRIAASNNLDVLKSLSPKTLILGLTKYILMHIWHTEVVVVELNTLPNSPTSIIKDNASTLKEIVGLVNLINLWISDQTETKTLEEIISTPFTIALLGTSNSPTYRILKRAFPSWTISGVGLNAASKSLRRGDISGVFPSGATFVISDIDQESTSTGQEAANLLATIVNAYGNQEHAGIYKVNYWYSEMQAMITSLLDKRKRVYVVKMCSQKALTNETYLIVHQGNVDQVRTFYPKYLQQIADQCNLTEIFNPKLFKSNLLTPIITNSRAVIKWPVEIDFMNDTYNPTHMSYTFSTVSETIQGTTGQIEIRKAAAYGQVYGDGIYTHYDNVLTGVGVILPQIAHICKFVQPSTIKVNPLSNSLSIPKLITKQLAGAFRFMTYSTIMSNMIKGTARDSMVLIGNRGNLHFEMGDDNVTTITTVEPNVSGPINAKPLPGITLLQQADISGVGAGSATTFWMCTWVTPQLMMPLSKWLNTTDAWDTDITAFLAVELGKKGEHWINFYSCGTDPDMIHKQMAPADIVMVKATKTTGTNPETAYFVTLSPNYEPVYAPTHTEIEALINKVAGLTVTKVIPTYDEIPKSSVRYNYNVPTALSASLPLLNELCPLYKVVVP